MVVKRLRGRGSMLFEGAGMGKRNEIRPNRGWASTCSALRAFERAEERAIGNAWTTRGLALDGGPASSNATRHCLAACACLPSLETLRPDGHSARNALHSSITRSLRDAMSFLQQLAAVVPHPLRCPQRDVVVVVVDHPKDS
uniref:Uncharacterized protein n=1 Tax=Panagrellus redivivus TaxID=6233 RepID=A0A7E4VLE6_PANRE